MTMKRRSTTRKTRKRRSTARKAKVQRAMRRTRRTPPQVSYLANLALTLHASEKEVDRGPLDPSIPPLPQCAILNTVHAWLTLVQEQAPPKKKLKTAPVVEAAQKNGTAANGHGKDERAEVEEEEEFDEEDEEDEEAEGEEDEEEEDDVDDEEVPAKGVGKVAAPAVGKADSKAVAAGSDEED
jgi:hypothetical protein